MKDVDGEEEAAVMESSHLGRSGSYLGEGSCSWGRGELSLLRTPSAKSLLMGVGSGQQVA